MAAEVEADDIQTELVLAEEDQVGEVVLAKIETVSVTTGDPLDERQSGVERALVIARFVGPDLLRHGRDPETVLVGALRVITGISTLKMAVKEVLEVAFRIGVDFRLHDVRHSQYTFPAITKGGEGMGHQALLVLDRLDRKSVV